MAYRNNSIVDGPGSGNPDDPYDFEKGRIRALRDEHLYIQKKTFTKWVNSFLIKCRIEVGNLNFQTLFEKLPFLAISNQFHNIVYSLQSRKQSTKGQFLKRSLWGMIRFLWNVHVPININLYLIAIPKAYSWKVTLGNDPDFFEKYLCRLIEICNW